MNNFNQINTTPRCSDISMYLYYDVILLNLCSITDVHKYIEY